MGYDTEEVSRGQVVEGLQCHVKWFGLFPG